VSAKRIQFTSQELSALMAVVHGAQDDDDGDRADYSAALASSHKKLARALRAANSHPRPQDPK
jgi:hypothetical protein